MDRHSFRKAAVPSRAGSKHGGSVKTGASKGRKAPGIVPSDPRVASSALVLEALTAVILSQPGAPAAGEEIPASLYFGAIMSALRADEAAHTDEVGPGRGPFPLRCGRHGFVVAVGALRLLLLLPVCMTHEILI